MPAINDSKILIIATDGFEQSELVVPRDKLREHGATVHLASPSGDGIKGWDNANWGHVVEVDAKIEDVRVDDYDAIVLPGGQINPDLLRTDKAAVKLVKDFVQSDKIVAAICHGPWMLVEADVVRGRDMTSYHSISTDLRNAGANWIDKDVVVSNGIITSRKPDDLDAFVAKIVEEVEEGEHQRPAA
ncbi:type 1 glutamine amidotransferase domain-containing protein [Roseitranquillus sediminis]|uniref:type 1 glutamine amidotransferase domain-containing protein n=1 Tax=Roseitranquillus sediminis TaxID=2809051 RepID=UPI001D0C5279|nr:type 1 glutamine amidotransferase domain-containing protein [Roseitranquillus sediminis]MBM9595364.1 type 1 glutamine amidotransferase [Roseitranquillus sediminis]